MGSNHSTIKKNLSKIVLLVILLLQATQSSTPGSLCNGNKSRRHPDGSCLSCKASCFFNMTALKCEPCPPPYTNNQKNARTSCKDEILDATFLLKIIKQNRETEHHRTLPTIEESDADSTKAGELCMGNKGRRQKDGSCQPCKIGHYFNETMLKCLICPPPFTNHKENAHSSCKDEMEESTSGNKDIERGRKKSGGMNKHPKKANRKRNRNRHHSGELKHRNVKQRREKDTDNEGHKSGSLVQAMYNHDLGESAKTTATLKIDARSVEENVSMDGEQGEKDHTGNGAARNRNSYVNSILVMLCYGILSRYCES